MSELEGELQNILGPEPSRATLSAEERTKLERERAAHAPGPWYDHIVQELARAQVGTREGHLALAAAWRGGADNLLRISEARSKHAELLRSLIKALSAVMHPDLLELLDTIAGVDDFEAAAWLTASASMLQIAKAHERLAENVPDAAQAAADLGTAAERHDVNGLRGVLRGEQQLRERDMQGVVERLISLEATVGVLVRELTADRARADRQRLLILQALNISEGGDA